MKSKEQKRKEAVERQHITESTAPEIRILALDAQFGAGQGAKRERAWLMAAIERSKS